MDEEAVYLDLYERKENGNQFIQSSNMDPVKKSFEDLKSWTQAVR